MLAPDATDLGYLAVSQPVAGGHGPTTAPDLTAGPAPSPTATASTPAVTTSSTPVRHACSKKNCGKSFGRPADLRRHMRQHDPHATLYSCPFEYCNRKGARGFSRRDKLTEHRRALGH
ncbi:hypothetical protein CONLIGDRAFT_682639 [Coniochaeta ligniaria NRRL 30616]|uniref:C2H2-type domain-containing protein n=1 Tax=Coniochaeta ligniaria NRRL 30616 TaxID=1408157 RepID=A0A1J7JEE1_9PEZI|nr:hypothetical protein CONLIGDRAFT_682639 [Coniochaeta ligniaria NRRL 30616]